MSLIMQAYLKRILVFYLLCLLTVTAYPQASKNKLPPHIENIVNKLRKEPMVHLGHPVEYDAVPETNNKHYRQFLKLKRKATNEDLVLLTKDSSTHIFIYAFHILWEKSHPQLKDIFLEHQHDTTFFWTAGGCTGVLDRVNWYMLRKLIHHKSSQIPNYLSNAEIDFYCERFKKQNELFSCF